MKMIYDLDFEEYYEPSATDIIILEAKQKLEECIKEKAKGEIESIKRENIHLKQQLEEYKQKERGLRNREWKIEQKEKDIERDFYRKKFEDVIKPFESKETIYIIDNFSKLIPKCNKCNEDRILEYTSEYGDKILGKCCCNQHKTYHHPIMKELKTLNFYKGKGKFRATPKYDSYNGGDTYFKIDFKESEINKFDKDIADNFRYFSDYFISKELCQQYCDYFNKKNGWEA